MSETEEQQGYRRPQPEDVEPVLDQIGEGKSLRAACRELGIHPGHMHAYLHADDGLKAQYGRALELRADFQQEEALTVAKAAALGRTVDGKKVDASGARVLLEAIKWATARMAPKSAPIERHHHTFGSLSDEEIDGRIAALTTVDETDEAEEE